MSQNIPPRHERKKKPDYKIRPGFTQEEFESFQDFCIKNDIQPGWFTRRTLLLAIKTPVDLTIKEPS